MRVELRLKVVIDYLPHDFQLVEEIREKVSLVFSRTAEEVRKIAEEEETEAYISWKTEIETDDIPF